MGKGVIIVLTILVLGILAVGGYFLMFSEKCPEGELLNPYQDKCVDKNVLCNLDRDCTLLEGQTASFPSESLNFELVSAKDNQGRAETTINIGNSGEVSLFSGSDFSYGEYTIYLESVDGDSDKLMGASFEVIKS